MDATTPLTAPRLPAKSKYVITVDATGQEHPLVFSYAIEHKQAVPAYLEPVAAGFLFIYNGRLVIPAIDSSTLALGPRPQDKDILANFLGLTPSANSLTH
jgi:hypothetical protein